MDISHSWIYCTLNEVPFLQEIFVLANSFTLADFPSQGVCERVWYWYCIAEGSCSS